MESSHGLKTTHQIGRLDQKIKSGCLKGPNDVKFLLFWIFD